MTWTWKYEDAAGTEVGVSAEFDARGDAESWIGEAFGDLSDDGVAQVRLFDGAKEIYGPMSLSAE